MGDLTILQTIVLAIVEGLTEFLPVSSTGHMIIAQNLMGIESTPFVKAFTVIIQFGAILSVVVLYYKRFFKLDHTPAPKGSTPIKQFLHKWDFYWKLLVAFIPAIIIGGLGNKLVDELLGSVTIVASMLVIGGIFMLFCDRIFDKGTEKTVMTEKRAFYIGLFQCIAMIPGVSRSMATIVGGMSQKFTRKTAAEFSFFLAVPTMFAATVLDLLKLFKSGDAGAIKSNNVLMLILGCVIAFFVALVAIKGFINFLTKYGFQAFGYYRIIVGGFILAWLLSGHTMALVD
ncbi:MAG: undecaprenyl-diphosphate phosphatase [Bacteroidaceae bacterium]|nr:undecaprenyl-diphosphate phosphatase [Bacteroidaceae bacterium]